MKETIRAMVKEAGIHVVGFAGKERLTGPPSMNPEYLLPGAQSIINLMIPLDKGIVRRYLSKEDHQSYWEHEGLIYKDLYVAGEKISTFLIEKGYMAITAEPNLKIRGNTT